MNLLPSSNQEKKRSVGSCLGCHKLEFDVFSLGRGAKPPSSLALTESVAASPWSPERLLWCQLGCPVPRAAGGVPR